MKTWDTLYPWVLPYVPGCPDPTVDRALCDAAREFCTASSAWAQWSDAVTAPGTTQRFEFDVPSGSEVVRARRAMVGDCEWQALPSTHLPVKWEDEEATEPCERLVHIDLAEFLLIPAPSAGVEFRVELILKPAVLGTGIGDEVFNKYAEAVANGAKARLLVFPGTTWTDPKTAGYCRQQFDSAIHSAANEGWRQRTPGARRVKSWG